MNKTPFKYRSVGVDNSKKSREQFSKDRLYDAKHVRKLLEEQEKTLEARGEEVRRRFKQAEIAIKESEK